MMNKDNAPEVRPDQAAIPTSEDSSQQPLWLKLLLRLSVVGFLAIFCLSILLYFALLQFKDDIVAAISGLTASNDGPAPLNRIAFIGNDNNIWLVSPSGEDLRSLTNDATARLGYTIPTWSPDDRYVAVAGPGQSRQIALYLFPNSADAPDPTVLYSASDSAPFYLYWAPDSHALTFLTQEESGLSMRLARVDRAGNSQGVQDRVIDEGSPFYWAWSPDSDQVFMHVGGARTVSTEAHLSLWANKDNAEKTQLNLAPGQFQAPLWSADGRYIYYVAEEGATQAIYRMTVRTLEQEMVARLRGLGRTFMVISPDGKYLAFLEADLERPVPLGTPYVVDLKTFETRLVTRRPVMSMYWSPNSARLALLTVELNENGPSTKAPGHAAPLPQDIRFSWWVYEVAAETLDSVITVNPPAEFLQTVPYFDQYHLSLTLWSPDSRYLVVTSRESESDEGTVMVVDAAGQEEPRRIGAGKMAVWSWK